MKSVRIKIFNSQINSKIEESATRRSYDSIPVASKYNKIFQSPNDTEEEKLVSNY